MGGRWETKSNQIKKKDSRRQKKKKGEKKKDDNKSCTDARRRHPAPPDATQRRPPDCAGRIHPIRKGNRVREREREETCRVDAV